MTTATPQAPADRAPEPPPASTGLPLRGLLRAELRRLRLRRLLLLGAVGYFALLVLVLGASFVGHSTDDGSARAQAEQNLVRERAVCVEDLRRNPPPELAPGDEASYCEIPLEAFYQDPRYVVARSLPNDVMAVGGTFAVVAFLLGASAVGAEWSARTLPALLHWEPRRARVLLTKLAALLLAVAALAAAAQLITVGAGVLTGQLRGTFAGVDAVPGGFWAALWLQSLRGALFAVAAATVGFAVATITRSSAAVLGLAFAYLAVVEIAVQSLRPQWGPWLATSNIAGWLQRGGYEMRIVRPEVNLESGFVDDSSFYRILIENWEAGLYLFGIAAVLVALATWSFRRRDLT